MIKKTAPFLLLPFLVCSCATILNQPLQKIVVATDGKLKITDVDKGMLSDSSKNQSTYYVPRSAKPITVKFLLDSVEKTTVLKPSKSLAYWSNIYFNYGVGMLVDRFDAKRFAYPVQSYFTLKDSSIKRSRFVPYQKGSINIALSLPFVNAFYIERPNGKYHDEGFFGIAGDIEYFHHTNQYISLGTGAATTKGFGEYFGPAYITTANTVYINARNNHVLGSFDLGYGLNASRFFWRRTAIGDTIKLNESYRNTAIGLSFSAQYRIGKYFRTGILYQPSLFKLAAGPSFNYQQYISFSVLWKLPIKHG